MPALVIAGLVHMAVELNEEAGSRRWSAHFTQRADPSGVHFMIGQNSCCVPARLQVRPEGGSQFDRNKKYANIEVAWCVSWRPIGCEGHSHSNIKRETTINILSDRIEQLAEAIRRTK